MPTWTANNNVDMNVKGETMNGTLEGGLVRRQLYPCRSQWIRVVTMVVEVIDE